MFRRLELNWPYWAWCAASFFAIPLLTGVVCCLAHWPEPNSRGDAVVSLLGAPGVYLMSWVCCRKVDGHPLSLMPRRIGWVGGAFLVVLLTPEFVELVSPSTFAAVNFGPHGMGHDHLLAYLVGYSVALATFGFTERKRDATADGHVQG